MYNAANNAQTRLAQPLSASDTEFFVQDTSGFPEPPFVVTIGDEIIEVGSIDVGTGTMGDLVRGIEGTTPQTHSAEVRVENRFTAGTYHKLKDVLEGLFIEEGADWEVDD